MPVFIVGLGTAVPPKRYTQKECWTALRGAPQFQALKPRSKATLQHVLLSESNGIATRHLALDSLADAFTMDPDTLHARFARFAPGLASAAGARALRDADQRPDEVDALIVSTCTGYLCPGLTSYVGEQLGLRPDALGLDLVGQGCGAALPNLRTGEGLIAAKRSGVVLSVCVEVCSAAFYIDDDTGVLVSACLFGDGAAAAVLAPRPLQGRRRIQWKKAWSHSEPAARDALRFEQRGGMLRNILTPQVPALAGKQASALLQAGLRDSGLRKSEVAAWLWHAGGQRVLQELCAAGGLEPAQVQRSARILNDFGNISSPFVYFVLELALRERAPDGWWWLSSFGAGFACHGALLSVSSS